MSGDAHVRICESLGVQFPWATRLVVSLSRKQMYWRAVDGEGEVLEILVQPTATRPQHCACSLNSFIARASFRRLSSPKKLRSYGAALRELVLRTA
jgi:hypothetical protein